MMEQAFLGIIPFLALFAWTYVSFTHTYNRIFYNFFSILEAIIIYHNCCHISWFWFHGSFNLCCHRVFLCFCRVLLTDNTATKIFQIPFNKMLVHAVKINSNSTDLILWSIYKTKIEINIGFSLPNGWWLILIHF